MSKRLLFRWGALTLLGAIGFYGPIAAQCDAPTPSSLLVTGPYTATVCWESSQGDVTDHHWNLLADDLTNGITAVVDLDLQPGDLGLTISPGTGGPAPITVCYELALPSGSTEYAISVAEQCDGAIPQQSAATALGSLTTDAAPVVFPMPTAFQTVSQTVTHTASFTDISLDPSPLVGNPSRLTFTRDLLSDINSLGDPNTGTDILFSIIENLLGVNIPNWIKTEGVSLGIPGVIEFELEPTLNIGVTADYGGFIGLKKVGKADVDVSYPVNIMLSIPEDQAFGCSDKIVVETSATRGAGATVSITPAFYETEMGPIFENASFVIEIGLIARIKIGCVPDVGCAYRDSWDLLDELNIPNGELV
ncbi:MAG: hypothetical protein KDC54_04270, partial [Lewinella sp.]|nr:hypothetical protein [Lewinella sp.]